MGRTTNPTSRHAMLSRRSPSRTRGIVDTVVAKEEELFLVVSRRGHVPASPHHGCGLYWRDMRYLSACQLEVDGRPPEVLLASPRGQSELLFRMWDAGGGRQERAIGIALSYAVDGPGLAVVLTIGLHSYAIEPTDVTVRLQLGCDFRDVFEVRGLVQDDRPHAVTGAWVADSLVWARTGLDALERSVHAHFLPDGEHLADGVRWHVRLDPGAHRELKVRLSLAEKGKGARPVHRSRRPPEEVEAFREARALLHTDDELVEMVVRRAIDDLAMLRTPMGNDRFLAAGIPWFATLFGRDSIVSALQSLAWRPGVARGTLDLLHRWQGTEFDRRREEQPGKILHELRRGELANVGAIPHTPYYGTVDATPLFLCLFGRWLAWTDDRATAEALRPAVEGALGWIDGAVAGDGLVWYGSDQEGGGLVNQGWKDSGDAVVNADGSLATPPIALVEVQGYVSRAWDEVALWFERTGQHARADQLRARARDMRARIRDAFRLGPGRWALALQRDRRPCDVRTSNPGHLLWCGALDDADDADAAELADALLAPTLWTGWGVRTLASDERRFNPLGYHVGTVWPHDNAFLAAGLRRYRRDDDAAKLCEGLLSAAARLSEFRLPELICGFSRETNPSPVPYPIACHPQAWGAGAVLSAVHTLLGLTADAHAHVLRVIRPRLPGNADRLWLRGLRVGDASVDLTFRRDGDTTRVEVDDTRGELRVEVEEGTGGGMPTKKAIERAKKDKEAGKAPSTQAGEFVREEVRKYEEGDSGIRSRKQAIAIGLSEARRAGVELEPPKEGEAAERTVKKAERDLERGKEEGPLAKREGDE